MTTSIEWTQTAQCEIHVKDALGARWRTLAGIRVAEPLPGDTVLTSETRRSGTEASAKVERRGIATAPGPVACGNGLLPVRRIERDDRHLELLHEAV